MPKNLAYIINYGSNGSGNNNVANPNGFATDGKHLFIADTANNRILKWNLEGGGYVAQTGSTGSGDENFSVPADIEIFRDRLFIVDQSNHRIKVYTKDLVFVKSFGSSGTGNTNFSSPTSITTDGESLYISDTGNDRIVVYDRDLAFDFKFGSNGSGNNNFDSPRQIAFDKHENVLYVVDLNNTRVSKLLKLATTFRFVDSIVAADSTDASLAGLSGVAVKDHYVYLLEGARIQVFDAATLTTRTTAGSTGSGNTNISDGAFIKTYKNTVIFSDTGNDRLNIWYDYKPARSFSSGDTRKISGAWFVNPIIPIGGKQERQDVTIGGTATKDLFNQIEEEQLSDCAASVEEI